MPNLTEEIIRAWDSRNGPVVLATVDAQGIPNIIYATCVSRYSEDMLVVADNYFEKTRSNILRSGKGAILFIMKDNKAYQVKGELEYHREGPIYKDMKKWNDPKHPGHAAVSLKVDEVYSGSAKLL